MNKEKAFGEAYPKSLAAALRRASDLDINFKDSPPSVTLTFNNVDNADAAYEWLSHIKRWESQ